MIWKFFYVCDLVLPVNPLLMSLVGPPSALDKICGEGLLFEQEKMEVFRSRNIVRVTTLQHKRRWITNQVKEALNSISRTTIDLRNITPLFDQGASISHHINPPMLDELSRLTNCLISRTNETLVCRLFPRYYIC